MFVLDSFSSVRWWLDELLDRDPGERGGRAASQCSSDADAEDFITQETNAGGAGHKWSTIEDWMLDGADWMGDRSESSSSFEVPSPEVINLVSSEDKQPGKTVYREKMGAMDNHS